MTRGTTRNTDKRSRRDGLNASWPPSLEIVTPALQGDLKLRKSDKTGSAAGNLLARSGFSDSNSSFPTGRMRHERNPPARGGIGRKSGSLESFRKQAKT